MVNVKTVVRLQGISMQQDIQTECTLDRQYYKKVDQNQEAIIKKTEINVLASVLIQLFCS